MKIGAIIQARMGSTRLPEKVMKELFGKTVLEHVIERVGQSKCVDEIIIATTVEDRDSIIFDEAIKCGAKAFKGSENDVLSRYYFAAKENNLDVIVRVTSDCPLIDPLILDEMIEFYLNNEFDIVTNAGSDVLNRTFPRGLDTEIFSFQVLEDTFINAKENYQREHVTPYIYETSECKEYFMNEINYSKYRWTLDTDEDFKLISDVYNYLYHGKHDFYFQDIIKLFESRPELYDINAHIEQKKIK